MGSWNVSCMVTGLSIGPCDKVAFIPLKAQKEKQLLAKGEVLYGLFYPTEYFAPATYPIFGTYDDYGGVEDIERDENVLYLEKKFNMKIENILSMDSRLFDGGVFILREIYDFIIQEKHHDKYSVEQFTKACQNYKYMVRRRIRDDVTFLKICKRQMNDPNQSEENRTYASTSRCDRISDILDIRNSFDVTFRLDGAVLFERMPNLKDIYFNKIVGGAFAKEMMSMCMLYLGLHSSGTQFFPTVNGPQCGEDDFMKKLTNLAHKYVVNRIKDRERY